MAHKQLRFLGVVAAAMMLTMAVAGTARRGVDLKHGTVQSLYFKEQDAGAMVGVMAGWMEKNDKAKKNKHVIGAVGGISIPPVDHYIAGYKWAAKMEDPGIQV